MWILAVYLIITIQMAYMWKGCLSRYTTTLAKSIAMQCRERALKATLGFAPIARLGSVAHGRRASQAPSQPSKRDRRRRFLYLNNR